MNRENLRYECLRLAVMAGFSADEALAKADRLMDVLGSNTWGKPSDFNNLPAAVRQAIDEQLASNERVGDDPAKIPQARVIGRNGDAGFTDYIRSKE